MGDPQRLLGLTHEGDELERELLQSVRDVSPHQGAKGEAWNRLAVQAAAVAVIGTGSASVHAVASSSAGVAIQATKALTAKIVLGVALAGSTAVGGGWWLHQRSTATPVAHVRAEPEAPSATSMVPAPAPVIGMSEAVPESVTANPKAVDRAPKSVEDRTRRDQLTLESRLLTEARAQLHNGDPRGAQATLDRLRARSPKGVLTQERDVLTIQILSALGDASAAKRKAQEFLDAYPESPHAAQLRRLTGAP